MFNQFMHWVTNDQICKKHMLEDASTCNIPCHINSVIHADGLWSHYLAYTALIFGLVEGLLTLIICIINSKQSRS